MPVDAAPSGYVFQGTAVGAQGLDPGPGGKIGDAVLYPDDGQRAEQLPAVEDDLA